MCNNWFFSILNDREAFFAMNEGRGEKFHPHFSLDIVLN